MITKDTPKDVRYIIDYIEDCTGLRITDRTRKKNYVFARSCASHLCEQLTANSLAAIGDALGVAHDVVIHYRSVFQDAYRKPFFRDLGDGFDPTLLTKSTRIRQYVVKHYRDAYIEAKSRIREVEGLLNNELEPHEIEYRKLSPENKERFKVMANAKIKMLNVTHEIK